jgi:hypothetical protein
MPLKPAPSGSQSPAFLIFLTPAGSSSAPGPPVKFKLPVPASKGFQKCGSYSVCAPLHPPWDKVTFELVPSLFQTFPWVLSAPGGLVTWSPGCNQYFPHFFSLECHPAMSWDPPPFLLHLHLPGGCLWEVLRPLLP